jgi:hypothetical protein
MGGTQAHIVLFIRHCGDQDCKPPVGRILH